MFTYLDYLKTDLEKGIKPILKTNIWVQLYDIFEKAKCWRYLKDQCLPGAQERGRRGKMKRSSTGDTLGNESILYDVCDYYSVILDGCRYAFVKTHRSAQNEGWSSVKTY